MKKYLRVRNIGNFDSRRTEMYSHEKLFPLEIGTYSMPIGWYGCRNIEIISVFKNKIEVVFRGLQYNLTEGSTEIIEETKRQTSDDGPSFTAEDTVYLSIFEQTDDMFIANNLDEFRKIIIEHLNDPHFSIKALFNVWPKNYEDLVLGLSYSFSAYENILRVAQIFIEWNQTFISFNKN